MNTCKNWCLFMDFCLFQHFHKTPAKGETNPEHCFTDLTSPPPVKVIPDSHTETCLSQGRAADFCLCLMPVQIKRANGSPSNAF